MRIRIEFCVEWDYTPYAARLAEELVTGLRNTVGHEHQVEMLELQPSGGGVFEVTVDGELIFSKKKAGRHTNKGEVLEMLKKRLK